MTVVVSSRLNSSVTKKSWVFFVKRMGIEGGQGPGR